MTDFKELLDFTGQEGMFSERELLLLFNYYSRFWFAG